MKQPKIEVLSFEGCPNGEEAVRLVQRVVDELDLELDIRVIDVPDSEAAERERFLGSPSIRVNGCDIEPGAEGRAAYVYACRIYRTSGGHSGLPDDQWLRDALSSGVR